VVDGARALRGRRCAAVAEGAARRGCWRRARRWRSGPGCVRGGRGGAAGGVGRVEGAWVWRGAGRGRAASGRDGDRSAAECRDSHATSAPRWCRAGSRRIPTWVGSLTERRESCHARQLRRGGIHVDLPRVFPLYALVLGLQRVPRATLPTEYIAPHLGGAGELFRLGLHARQNTRHR